MGKVEALIPLHERRILEAFVRKIPLNQLALQPNLLNEYEREELKNLIKLRAKGLPLQYLTGSQAFYGREFYINTNVLVPRPETEGLVELALAHIPRGQMPFYILDFGTGSGCIALTLNLERPESTVFAADCSIEALEVAKENARRHKASFIDFMAVNAAPQLNSFATLPSLNLIISNPPYLTETDDIATDVRGHEPSLALFAPLENPLYFYTFLADLMKTKLEPQGLGVFEIAEQRGPETAAVFEAQGFKTTIQKDLAGRDRYLLVR